MNLSRVTSFILFQSRNSPAFPVGGCHLQEVESFLLHGILVLKMKPGINGLKKIFFEKYVREVITSLC